MNRETEARSGDSKLVRLVRQSGVYALGNVVVKVSGLVLAPLYLNPQYLSIEAYGYFALLTITAHLGIFLTGLGLAKGLLKFATDTSHEHAHDALPFTSLVASAGMAALMFVVLWLLREPLAALLLGDPGGGVLIVLMGTYVGLKVVADIPMMVLRVRERVGYYTLAVTLDMALLIGAVYYFLVVRGQGLVGLMTGYAVAAGGTALVLVGLMLFRVPWRFRSSLLGALARFGAPLVVAGLAGWFLNAGDRYLLKLFEPAEAVGLYDWAARISGVLNLLLVQSFQLAFAVIGLKSLQGGEGGLHRRIFRHFIGLAGWAVLALAVLAYDLNVVLVRLFDVAEYYMDAVPLVLPLALGFLSYGLYYVCNNVLHAQGRTASIGAVVAAAAVLNALLNLALIPWLGTLGAALSTFLAYTALAAMTARLAEREVQIGFGWNYFARMLLLVGALYVVGWWTMPWPLAWGLPARLVIVASYPVLMVVIGIYRRDEWNQLRGKIRQYWRA